MTKWAAKDLLRRLRVALKRTPRTVYPLTIIADRYSGTYSGGAYHAWNLDPEIVPDGHSGGDMEAMDFWMDEEYKTLQISEFRGTAKVVGLGPTPDAALHDLAKKMKEITDAG
jgi:hypothetical protein